MLKLVLGVRPQRLFTRRHIFSPCTSGFQMAANQQTKFDGNEMEDLYSKFVDLFKDYGLFSNDFEGKKVVDFKHPEELLKTLPLQITDKGCTNEELLQAVKAVMDYSVNTAHPRFANQLYNRGDMYGIAGSWLTDVLNTNEHTYEVAPAFIAVIKYLTGEFQKVVGYKEADMMFFPGGSAANLSAINLARFWKMPQLQKTGMKGADKPLTMFSSQESHYCIKKGAMFMGFGTENVRTVKTNENGKMCMKDLRAKIEESLQKGEQPFYVMATSGSTVIGGFDPLEEIADICDEYDLWMHVDGCWGGAVLFSDKHKHLMKGVERSRSFCISLHKMLGAPIQCVPLVVHNKTILSDAYEIKVPYLFQPDKFYDTSYDVGNKTFQCGRRSDAMKFWIMWKARGHQGFQQHVEQAFVKAKMFTDKIRNRPGFRFVLPEFEYLNISYWFIPPSMRDQVENEEWKQKLHKVAPEIKKRMVLNGSMMIGYQPMMDKDRVNFFRIIIQNSNMTEKDMDFIIEETERLGNDL